MFKWSKKWRVDWEYKIIEFFKKLFKKEK